MKQITFFLFSITLAWVGCAQKSQLGEKAIGGPCEDCLLMFEGMPSQLSSSTKLAPPDEPGEQLEISGTIFQQDGKTPAAGVVLYVYHTDNKGLYSKSPGQKFGARHGHLRGWVKTDANGRYQFNTIRPASYPNSKNPQHIHPIVYEPGKGYYWIDEFLFEDDPVLTANERSHLQNRGGAGVIRLTKNQKGWVGRRDIILGQNVPGYQ